MIHFTGILPLTVPSVSPFTFIPLNLHSHRRTTLPVPPFIKHLTHDVVSDLPPAIFQLCGGKLGPVSEFYLFLRKHLLLRRGTQKHQRCLPPGRCRLTPGSKRLHWECPRPAHSMSSVTCARHKNTILTEGLEVLQSKLSQHLLGLQLHPTRYPRAGMDRVQL